MSPTDASSLEAGLTRCETPGSTSSLTVLASDNDHDNNNEDAETPPTSVADSADTSSRSEKQDSPVVENTIAQPAGQLEAQPIEAVATATEAIPPQIMAPPPPPSSTGRKSLRARKSINYDFDLQMRQASGHQKRGPMGRHDIVKNEADTPSSRRQTMSEIPAFDNDSDASMTNTPTPAESSRRVQIPDQQNDSAVSDLEMDDVAQSNVEGQSGADESNYSTKRTTRKDKEEQQKKAEEERTKRRVAQLEKQLALKNEEVLKLQLKIDDLKSGATPSKNTVSPSPAKLKREMKRLGDTKEYTGKVVEEGVTIIEEVWVKGKKLDPNAPPPVKKPRKNARSDLSQEPEIAVSVAPVIDEKPIEVKKAFAYLKKPVYSGAEYVDPWLTPKQQKDQKASGFRCRKLLPLPMGPFGKALCETRRDYMLPYAVCNPIVGRQQEKPENWSNAKKNRFVGDALGLWKSGRKDEGNYKCQCKPEDGCGAGCTNRASIYECTEDNCNIGKDLCTNRDFADLAARTAKGNKFDIGVDVVRTGDTGFGVRANRAFKDEQIIVEYCGEVITEEEADRRMIEEYKDKKCCYLMAFEQGMIIDAQVRGSIARFVNHSCDPNCEMKKVVVSGEPRMALFAQKDISTGEELTYDYNFSPFSMNSMQECFCGSDKCRGYLQGKTADKKKKEQQSLAGGVVDAARGAGQSMMKAAKGAVKNVKTAGRDLKRKANDLISLDDDTDEAGRNAGSKKRKTATPKSPGKIPNAPAFVKKVLGMGRTKSLPTAASTSFTPINGSRSFLGGRKADVVASIEKTVEKTVEKKQLKLSFHSSDASSGARKRKVDIALRPPTPDEENQFFVLPSDDEDLDEISTIINTIVVRKPLPSGPMAPPASTAQGKGGNRLRLVVNPSSSSSTPASGQSSRDATPGGEPVEDVHQNYISAKKPRFRAQLNKTPYERPTAPTPGPESLIPKRVRKKKSASPSA